MAQEKVLNNTESVDTTYDHIVKYIGLFGGVQGLNLLIGIVRNKITAYILGPSGIGLINVYNKVTSLVGQTTNLGISFSAVKHVAELSEISDSEQRDKVVDTVRMWCLMTAAFGLLVGLLLSPWISLYIFGNYDYTLSFGSLSLIVAMMAVTGGEIAILKGLRQLKMVAMISIFAALATSFICVPIYFCWGLSGVVSALVVSNAAILVIHLCYSSKVSPWRKTVVTLNSLKAGSPMVKLGVAYLLAGILVQGSEFFIITFIQHRGGLECVGLYNTGFLLVSYIGSLFFTAVEADYFPRLSALGNDKKSMNIAVNKQIEVCVLLMTPCLMMEIVAMPLIIRLLYTEEFVAAAPMAIYATFYLFFKAMTLPVAYLALAKGDSKTFFFAELLYSIFAVFIVPFLFTRYGLNGAGMALSLAGLFDLLLIYCFYGVKYGFRLALRPMKTYVLQALLLGLCVYVSVSFEGQTKWMLGGLSLLVSASLSLCQLYLKTDVWKSKVRKSE